MSILPDGPTPFAPLPPAPRRGPLRTVLAVLLLLVALVLLLLSLVSTVQVATGSIDDAAGLVFLWGMTLLALQGTRIAFRAPRRPHVTPPAPPVAPPGWAPPSPSPLPSPSTQAWPPPAQPPANAPLAWLPGRPVDRSVSYRQSFCQVPILGTLVAVTLTVGYLLLVTQVPFMNRSGPQDIVFIIGAAPILYLVGVAIYLPYRVRIRDGVLTAGVVGVPRFGRAWRTLSVDLGNVECWQVRRAPRAFSPEWRTTSGRWPRPDGRPLTTTMTNGHDLRALGGRHLLVVYAAPGTIGGTAYPEQVLAGYSVRAVPQPGDGPLVIRLRRGRSLHEALRRAMPTTVAAA